MKRFFSTTSWCNYIKKKADHTHLRPWREHPFFIEVVEKTKDPSLAFHKWKYQPLPTQTVLDKTNPQFSVRSPEFKLPSNRGRISRKQWRKQMAELQQSRNNPELEKLSRNRKLFVDIEHVNNEWKKNYGLADVSKLARFYGINRDIFNDDDVVLKTWLNVAFDDVIIHRGNFIEPKKLLHKPSDIRFEGEQGKLYSLIMTNIDGHPLDDNKEIIHWLVCNIPNNDVNRGDSVFDYLPPIPWKGSGFHRLLFSVHEQEGQIDTRNYENERTIGGRTFDTYSYLNHHKLSVVGLSWCQLEWDESVSQSYNQFQDLSEEPIFGWEEYIEPKEEDRLLKRQLSELKYRNM